MVEGLDFRSEKNRPLIVILGPTASGKTDFSVKLASVLHGEIISADSRQVYRGMDIGTGKDLDSYVLGNISVPYHLIDIRDPNEPYSLFDFQRDFYIAYDDVCKRNSISLLCGGTGLYLESVIRGYELLEVPRDEALRERLSSKSIDELKDILESYGPLHNETDLDSKLRALRAIEISEYQKTHTTETRKSRTLDSIVFGLKISTEERRQRISRRLAARIEEGMIEEVRSLIEKGVDPQILINYGLEYRFVTRHLLGEISRDEMCSELETAIHRFAKRQMTWFRRMERNGIPIVWIDAALSDDEKIEFALSHLRKNENFSL